MKKSNIALAFVLFSLCGLAYASGSGSGGFESTISTNFNKLLNWISIALGSISVIALCFQLFLAMTDRKSWTDVLTTSIWIILLGLAPSLAKWLYTLGKGMSF